MVKSKADLLCYIDTECMLHDMPGPFLFIHYCSESNHEAIVIQNEDSNCKYRVSMLGHRVAWRMAWFACNVTPGSWQGKVKAK
jgi:hypothetical protein